MDIQLEKKKGLRKKHIPYVIGGALFVFLLGWIIFGDHAATLRVDARSLTVGEVRCDQFNDFFRVDGQVQPITVVQLSPEEGGIVQEKVVEEGAKVKRGETERLDRFQDKLQRDHPQILIEETDYYYDVDTFNACEQNGTLLLTLDAWADVHPSLVTLPVAWDGQIPYGILYAKTPSEAVSRFVSILRSHFD